jgi:hypothetical protein
MKIESLSMKNTKPVCGILILAAAQASGKGTEVGAFLGKIPAGTRDHENTLMSDTCIDQFFLLVNHKKSWTIRLLAKRHWCQKAVTPHGLRHSRGLVFLLAPLKDLRTKPRLL